MNEYEQKFLGRLYCLNIGETFLAHKNGSLKTWRTMRAAQKAAEAFPGARVQDVQLSVPVSVKPALAPTQDVIKVLNSLMTIYETGVPRTTICRTTMSDNVNVARFTPLRQEQVVEVGDRDSVVDVHLKFYVDDASMRDVMREGK